MSTPEERHEALEAVYAEAVESGTEVPCSLPVSYNDYTKFQDRHPDAIARFGKLPGGGTTGSGASSGSRMGQVRVWVPEV